MLVSLWATKNRLAKGRPFSVDKDIFRTTLDSLFATSFGLEAADSYTAAQIKHLAGVREIQLPASVDAPVEFSLAAKNPMFEALIAITKSVDQAMKSPFPKVHHWFLRTFTSLRSAVAIKERTVDEQIAKSVERVSQRDNLTRSALDEMIQREHKAALKEGRQPVYSSRALRDEVRS